MSSFRSALLAAALAFGGPGFPRAQEPPVELPAAVLSIEARIDKAIADYEAASSDPKQQARRNRALLWLGDLDHPRVTDYLAKELTAAGDSPFAAVVLQAIGRQARPQLQDAAMRVLRRDAAPFAARIAAANAIVRCGESGVDRLLDLVRSDDDTISDAARDFAVTALVQGGGGRALAGLAPRLLTGTQAERLRMLRRMDAAQGVAEVSLARIRLVAEGDEALAALAWRQLAAEGHPRARELTAQVLERQADEPPPAIAGDLVFGLCLVRLPEFYPAILRLGASTAAPVRNALRAVAPLAGKDPELVRFLATKGLENESPAVRDVALMLLREAPQDGVRPLLAKVRAALQKPNKRSLDLAVGLHDLLAKDPTWRTECALLAAAKEPEVRTVGLTLLLELGSDSGIEYAQQALGAKSWELRSIALRYLARFRDVASIPLLIARCEREEGRLAAELAEALFVHTGTRFWKRKEWEAWWAGRRVAFVLPHPETVKGGRGSGGGTTTVSYHDIPVVSSRAAFLIDHSGSMSARMGTDAKYTRLEAAKEQFARVVQALPKTHDVNLIVYESGVDPVWDELRPLDDKNRAELLARTKQLAPAGGTNIHDALEKAFADRSVDTIYLLTDGEPTAP
ncbi:MAG: VWA domain-containing protein, partial [Planctomycetes bacterium]|nr:VWA domain-containing protein [Planctomycetota bacterium]